MLKLQRQPNVSSVVNEDNDNIEIEDNAVVPQAPPTLISGTDNNDYFPPTVPARYEPLNDTEKQRRDRNFSFSKEGFTPSAERIQKASIERINSQSSINNLQQLGLQAVKPNVPLRNNGPIAPPSTITKPNFVDILRRVSVVIHQHILKCVERLKNSSTDSLETGVFHFSKLELFSEENYMLPKYCYDFTTAPIARMGFQYVIRKLKPHYKHPPTLNEIYAFVSDIFTRAQLTPECSIVCLIYVERLMENAHVPLCTQTWKPLLLCGLLLASKVWQDVGSWNIDIAEIFPQYTLQNINKLERTFCNEIDWDLYISTSVYAKYYFALRSITEKKDFRRNYNMMMKIEVPGAQKVANRTEDMKLELINSTMAQSV